MLFGRKKKHPNNNQVLEKLSKPLSYHLFGILGTVRLYDLTASYSSSDVSIVPVFSVCQQQAPDGVA